MKNIIVPTDFSDNAQKALKYAINIANEFGSAIHLVNGVDVVSATGIYTDVNNMLYESAMSRLKEIIRDESRNLQNLSLIVPKIIRGEIATGICDYAQEVKGDLIVMGTQGASGLKKIFVGTIAQGVINHSSIPVIVVPEESVYEAPGKVALTVDELHIHSEEVLQPFKKIVKAFDAKAVVFHFNEQYAMSETDPALDNYLDDIAYVSHNHYSSDRNVTKIIDDFVKTEGIDLLTMIRRKRSFLDRLFHKSVTSKEVFQSKIPLMILYDKA